MAACSEKLSKTQRKLLKRQHKTHATLLKHDGILSSQLPSQHVVVFNGGLGNGVTRDELHSVFCKYGQILDVTQAPDKSYAFVSYADIMEAQTAVQDMQGQEINSQSQAAQGSIKLYLAYVDKVPGIVSLDCTLPQGLILIEDAVTEQYEQSLLDSIDWDFVDPNAKESSSDMKHRRVKHYGYEFLYSINNVDPDTPLTQGIPHQCNTFIDSMLSGGHISKRADQLTVNCYQPGQGIPPHIDTHSAFDDYIMSLSLGAQVVLEFRHPDGRHVAVLVPQRSALIMTGESRYVWSHAITPRKTDVIQMKQTDQTDSKDNMTDSEKAQNSTASAGARLSLVNRGVRTSFTFRRIMHEPCQCSFPDQCDSQMKSSSQETASSQPGVNMPVSDQEAALMEEQHVHHVYEQIAGHFSDTRHSPWPQVAEFLNGQTAGSMIADIGCGNGKYLAVNNACFMVGCDRSSSLTGIAAQRSAAFVCDALALPLRQAVFDAAISIAVIHHLSTQERRCEAVSQIVQLLRPGGQALIYVWALEQERNKVKSKYLKKKSSDRAEEEALCGEKSGQTEASCAVTGVTSDMSSLDIKNDNVHCSDVDQSENMHSVSTSAKLKVHVNRTSFETQDMLVPWYLKGQRSEQSTQKHIPEEDEHGTVSDTKSSENRQLFHRYYHVFHEGELEALCMQVPGVKIVRCYYDQGNWCIILEKL